MSALKKMTGKWPALILMSAFVLFGSGCIVVPHDYGHHGHRDHHDHERRHDDRYHDRHRY